ncbi:unnamed protein product [Cuscuta epithymum]|uniref:EF-hand domain-containing protein n=1 Tax=Cuscuta epithymum TaxID=186058 RepID=A0AAV0GJD8_9ASTE|nr:unnamed protein product [Cuscuta epithymum]CAH9147869.1 unnamed protein product [Cuscuta epithymum]
MGQVLDKYEGKELRVKQTRQITDKVYDRFKNESDKVNLSFEDLYISVLLIFNDINKHLPGPHIDPPSKEQVRALMKKYDFNFDGELNREEFMEFILELTKDTFFTISQKLVTTLAIAPTVALLTKKSTEGVPVIGKVVQKLPSSVYASLVTLAIVLFQKSTEAK